MAKRKKRGKKKTSPKPRAQTVTMDFGRPVVVDELRVYPDGRLELRHGGQPMIPESARTEISYERLKGRKVQSSATVSGFRLPIHPNHVLERADHVLWVDTNSRDYDGQRVHTTATLLAVPHRRLASHILYGWQRAQGLEFRGAVENPEAFAWCEIIERMRLNVRRLLHWSVRLVVDSHLGQLEAMNARTIPVWRDYFLPPNFYLVYASADVGGLEPLNAMMRLCDRDATRLFQMVVKADPGGSLATEASVIGGPRIRMWDAID